MSTRITHNFSMEEFACRDGTPYPSEWVPHRLRPLCLDLEVIRGHIGGPLYITSGYRTPDYNAAIRGARRSQHLEGRAADIFSPASNAQHLSRVIHGLYRRGEFNHIHAIGSYPTFVHVDVRPSSRLVTWGGSRILS